MQDEVQNAIEQHISCDSAPVSLSSELQPHAGNSSYKMDLMNYIDLKTTSSDGKALGKDVRVVFPCRLVQFNARHVAALGKLKKPIVSAQTLVAVQLAKKVEDWVVSKESGIIAASGESLDDTHDALRSFLLLPVRIALQAFYCKM